jgi:hypothetical protein
MKRGSKRRKEANRERSKESEEYGKQTKVATVEQTEEVTVGGKRINKGSNRLSQKNCKQRGTLEIIEERTAEQKILRNRGSKQREE